jgi:hypothetical protein
MFVTCTQDMNLLYNAHRETTVGVRAMLFYYYRYVCNCTFLLMTFFIACAGYAYHINAKRAVDDPKRKNYHPAAIFLAPITWPLFALGWLSLLTIKALLYGIFLILFAISLVVLQDISEPIWLEKMFIKIGNKLLEANTLLTLLLFPQQEPRAS